jgi:hypothetical protein
MQPQMNQRFPWRPFWSELIGTALLGLVGLSLVIVMFGNGSLLARFIPSEGLRRLITGFLFGTTGAMIALSTVGKPYSLPADWADEMLKRVNEEKKQSAQTAKLMAGQKREEIEKINLRLQKLLDAFLDGVIERNDYTAEKAKLMSQKKSLEEQSSALLKG